MGRGLFGFYIQLSSLNLGLETLSLRHASVFSGICVCFKLIISGPDSGNYSQKPMN